MDIVIYIVSTILFLILVAFKFLEINYNKKFLNKKILKSSDNFLKKIFVRVFSFIRRFDEVPLFFERLLKKFKNNLKHLKNFIIVKIVDYLNLDNVKNIERNKGSVSLFLQNISEDKSKK